MENEKTNEAKRREQRGKSVDDAFVFDRRSSFEMPNETTPRDSADDLLKLRKRTRNKSWASGALRKNFLPVEKRSQSSKATFDKHRPSHRVKYNGHPFDRNKTGRWQGDYIKMNVPKKWLRDYEKKQVIFFSLFFLMLSFQESCKTLSPWAASLSNNSHS